MLSLEEKRQILNSFKELREELDDFSRYFYYFDQASSRRKIIAREFVESGNGYVYGADLSDYRAQADTRGWVNVKYFSAEQLRDILRKAIEIHR